MRHLCCFTKAGLLVRPISWPWSTKPESSACSALEGLCPSFLACVSCSSRCEWVSAWSLRLQDSWLRKEMGLPFLPHHCLSDLTSLYCVSWHGWATNTCVAGCSPALGRMPHHTWCSNMPETGVHHAKWNEPITAAAVRGTQVGQSGRAQASVQGVRHQEAQCSVMQGFRLEDDQVQKAESSCGCATS